MQAARLLNADQNFGELTLLWRSRMPSASTSATHDRLMYCILPPFTLINEENTGRRVKQFHLSNTTTTDLFIQVLGA